MQINETLGIDPYVPPFVNDYLGTAKASSQTDAQSGIEINPSNTVEYIPTVYGYRQVTGIRLFTYVFGIDLYAVYALSEGYCRGIDQIFIDDNLLPIDYSKVTHRNIVDVTTGAYSGLLSVEFIDGRGLSHRNTVSGIGPSSLMALAGRTINYTDLAYLVCRFTYNNSQVPYQDVPKVTVNMFGRIMPEWTGATANNYSTNPVDIVWDILQHPIYGKNQTKTQLDTTSFQDVYDECDVVVTRDSYTYKQFTVNWVMDNGNSTFDNLQKVLETYNMTLNFVQGKWTLGLEALETASPITFNESNIIGSIEIHYPSVQEKYNRVYVSYQDKDANFVVRTQTFPAEGDNTFLTQDSGIVLENRISSNLVTDAYHANDLAQMMLRKSRGQLIYRFTVTKIALQCNIGDTAYINTTYPFIDNQQVKIISLTLKPDMTVELECALWSPGFYPTSFSNVVKWRRYTNQANSGTVGIITTPVTTPILPPEPSQEAAYSVFANKAIFNEGDSVVFTLVTTGIPNGTTVNYEISGTGITSADLSGESLTGTLTIQSNRAEKTFQIAEDFATDMDEVLVFRIFNSSATLTQTSITIKDTSLTPVYALSLTNTSSIQYQLIDSNNFYIEKTAIGSTGSSFDFGEREIVEITTTTGTFAAFRLRFVLYDRRNYGYRNYTLKYLTWDVVSHPNVKKDATLTSTLSQHSYDRNNLSWYKFDYNAPPTGQNANRSLRERPTPIQYDELIDYSQDTLDTPGAPSFNRRILPNSIYQYYSDFVYVPIFAFSTKNNAYNLATLANPKIFTVRTIIDPLASSSPIYATIKFRFWGRNADSSFREIYTQNINLAVTSNYITTTRLLNSNAVLKKNTGRTTNYW